MPRTPFFTPLSEECVSNICIYTQLHASTRAYSLGNFRLYSSCKGKEKKLYGSLKRPTTSSFLADYNVISQFLLHKERCSFDTSVLKRSAYTTFTFKKHYSKFLSSSPTTEKKKRNLKTLSKIHIYLLSRKDV